MWPLTKKKKKNGAQALRVILDGWWQQKCKDGWKKQKHPATCLTSSILLVTGSVGGIMGNVVLI